jgi:hypothetical protein
MKKLANAKKSTGKWYKTVEIVQDEKTGMVSTYTVRQVEYIPKEPDFIKIYYETMMAFTGVSGIPANVLCSLAARMEYVATDSHGTAKQMRIYLNKLQKEEIAAELGLKSISQVDRYIRKCVEGGILFHMEGYRGMYIANPFFIAKGSWQDIVDLRTEFDYVNHTWKFTKSEKNNDNTNK